MLDILLHSIPVIPTQKGPVQDAMDAKAMNKNPWTGKSTAPVLEPAPLPSLDGSFSVSNWGGYPSVGGVPMPEGPFRLLEGQEYKDALASKNAANKALHQAHLELKGFDIHEVKPVKFGGSPTHMNNKILLLRTAHTPYTNWWNAMMRQTKNLK